jgi:ribosome-binding factor A
MKPFNRTDRLNDQVRQVLAEVLEHEIQDPRVGFVTVTAVEVSRDLSVARVFVTVGGSDDREECLAGLKAAAGFLRRRLGEELNIRNIPEIHFQHDESLDHGLRINALLRQIAEERDESI